MKVLLLLHWPDISLHALACFWSNHWSAGAYVLPPYRFSWTGIGTVYIYDLCSSYVGLSWRICYLVILLVPRVDVLVGTILNLLNDGVLFCYDQCGVEQHLLVILPWVGGNHHLLWWLRSSLALFLCLCSFFFFFKLSFISCDQYYSVHFFFF